MRSIAALVLLAPIAAQDKVHITAPLFVSITPIGDLDCDGRPELIVGVPFHFFIGGPDGRAYVLSGEDLHVMHVLEAPKDAIAFGFCAADVGDVDGDGVPDVAIGAPGFTSMAGVSGHRSRAPGEVIVYSGRSMAPIQVLTGTHPSDGFGAAIDARADWDRDGMRDLLIGAPARPFESKSAGSVSIVSSRTWCVATTLHAEMLPIIASNEFGDLFGASVLFVDDVDHDGFADVVVGAPHANVVTRASSSSAKLRESAGIVACMSTASGKVLWSTPGRAQQRLGSSLMPFESSGAKTEIVCGAVSDSIHWISVATGRIVRSIEPRLPSGMEGFAHSIAVLGDLDHDGTFEIAAGRFDYTGFEFNVEPCALAVYDARSGKVLRKHASKEFGATACTLSDLDGDGVPEYVLVPMEEPLRAMIISGSTGTTLRTVELPSR